MKVPISEFRKNLFQIANQVLEGDDVEVAHKGQTIRLVLASSGSKLSRLTPAQIFHPDISTKSMRKPAGNSLPKCSGMGEGLVGTLICYLDTQVAIWPAEAKTAKISHKALSYIEKSEILICRWWCWSSSIFVRSNESRGRRNRYFTSSAPNFTPPFAIIPSP